MNRRSFFTKLAVGVVAAPAIVKALAEPRSQRVLLLDWSDVEAVKTPVVQVRRTTYYPYTGDNDVARAYAEAMQRAAKQVHAEAVDNLIKCAIF